MLIAAMEMMSDREDDPLSEQAVALAVILCQGEGVEIVEDMLQRVAYLVQVLMMEGLARKGFIDMHYDNISFDESAGEMKIATPRFHIPDLGADPAPPTGE